MILKISLIVLNIFICTNYVVWSLVKLKENAGQGWIGGLLGFITVCILIFTNIITTAFALNSWLG